MFEVIQSLSDSLYRRVCVEGTGSWSKESPGASASRMLFFGKETPLKNYTTDRRSDPR